MFRKKIFISFTVLSLFLLSACKPSSPKVAVTIYPVQYLVERIGGDYVEVDNLSDSQVIQTASIKKSYKNILSKDQVLFYVSGLEPYFDVYGEEIRTSKTDLVDLMSKSAFYKFQRYTTTYTNTKSVVVESAYYEGSEFSNIDMYDNDPTFWMDPMAMISAAEIIRDYLIEQYPEYEDTFNENFDLLELDLTRLDASYQELKDNSNISFVSISCNYGVWQKSYGVNVYPICLSKYGAIPNAKQLSIIKQKIIDDGIEYIVKEDNLSDDMNALYNSLVEELGLKEVEMSNLSSLSTTEMKENKDYLTIMYENLSSLESIANQ